MNQVEKWLKSKSNNPLENIFCKPTTESEALKALEEHFLPKTFYMCTSVINSNQFITEEISFILMNYPSYKFQTLPFWKKVFLKIHCFFTKTPIYYYY